MPQVESIQELRRRVQAPVEDQNDLTGRLYGSRLSIFVTRFFLKRGWSPDVATALMVINGLVGAGLLLLPGWGKVAGFFLLVTYYLFDCVDGELARYHGRCHLKAAYVDYLAHLLVKAATFLCLGAGLSLELAGRSWWPFYLSLAPVLAILFTKILSDLPGVLYAAKFLRYRDEMTVRNFERWQAGRGQAGEAGRPARRSLLGLLRDLALNFDVALVLFLLAALADRLIAPPSFLPAGLTFTLALFLCYAVAWPLHFLDWVLTDLRTDRFLEQVAVLRSARDGPAQPEKPTERP